MNRQLHNSDEVFISPQQGWEQMQLLLDKKLPVKNNKPARKIYFPILVAASTITVFLISTLELNNTAIVSSANRKVNIDNTNKPVTHKPTMQEGRLIAYSKHTTDGKKAGGNAINNLRTHAAGLSPASNDYTLMKIVPPEVIAETANQPNESLQNGNVIAKLAIIAIPKNAANNDSAGLAKKAARQQPKRRWNLSAGLAMNAMIGQQQNFTPYPAAVLSYNFSNKFFLSLGLAAGSHVSGESRGVKKQTYVNDMVNNIQFYNTVNQYYDISYADIPLLAGVHISKKFSLQAGVQASVLLKTKTKTIIEQYDFQMRMAGGGSNGFVNGTAAAPVSETNYRVEAKKMDYRITSGIKYNIHKLAFGLMYQHSLQPVLTGDLTSRNKHQLVTLNMQFNIK